MHKNTFVSILCIILALGVAFLTASCGADEANEIYSTFAVSTGTNTQSSTNKSTNTVTSALAGSSTRRGTETQKISFTYTGKVAQKRTIQKEAKYLQGYNGMRDVTAKQIVLDMKVGLCFDEYLDVSNEVAVSNIKSMLNVISLGGFNAVRIPVSFMKNANDSNYHIDSAFMYKVFQIASLAVSKKMYCIIALQENVSVFNTGTKFSDNLEKYTAVWKQVAEKFRGFNDYLLFQGFSELKTTKGDNVSAVDYDNINLLAKNFVSTVRASGGNNEVRHLIVSAYGSYSDSQTLSELAVPKDSVKNKMIVDAHLSLPSGFVGVASVDENEWGTDSDKNTLNIQLYLIYYNLTVQRGYPVIIGKFGASDKNNTPARTLYASYFVSTAYSYGMACFWNDDGNVYSLFDRKTAQMTFPEIILSMTYSIQ